jgi:hypothetical protein
MKWVVGSDAIVVEFANMAPRSFFREYEAMAALRSSLLVGIYTAEAYRNYFVCAAQSSSRTRAAETCSGLFSALW